MGFTQGFMMEGFKEIIKAKVKSSIDSSLSETFSDMKINFERVKEDIIDYILEDISHCEELVEILANEHPEGKPFFDLQLAANKIHFFVFDTEFSFNLTEEIEKSLNDPSDFYREEDRISAVAKAKELRFTLDKYIAVHDK